MQAPPLSEARPGVSSPHAGQKPETLVPALTAAHQLHPKQVLLLDFLNRHRDPLVPHQTLRMSYARLHEGTGITVDHIRRNALHRLFRNGFISVVSQSFAGTIYQLVFDRETIDEVVRQLQGSADAAQRVTTPAAVTLGDLAKDLEAVETQLSLLRQVHAQRQELKRQEFVSSLSPGQLQWLASQAKDAVDAQEGIRFVRDRFLHYEAQRVVLIDEWILRRQYGEHVPSAT